ncbi:hypothetical protein mRhiFer1_009336 [Rhinolophus ferrumequinum]|uniref:Integrase catalytic domain-containing protein n=1 Tax=Rhinolophus ferrumequinum TaxID=59479 RepID=A0A7J7RY80_RHIFE|nr:hypothetical protein mRhiFer1_009336 [Rhinolophus ferrumequinum]
MVARATGINWRLHTAYRPQSSGKVEHMNSLKETLAKLHQGTSLGWVDLLPLAILQVRCTPGKSGFSPFEIMFRWPPPLLTRLPGNIRQLGFSSLQNQMAALGKMYVLTFWKGPPFLSGPRYTPLPRETKSGSKIGSVSSSDPSGQALTLSYLLLPPLLKFQALSRGSITPRLKESSQRLTPGLSGLSTASDPQETAQMSLAVVCPASVFSAIGLLLFLPFAGLIASFPLSLSPLEKGLLGLYFLFWDACLLSLTCLSQQP